MIQSVKVKEVWLCYMSDTCCLILQPHQSLTKIVVVATATILARYILKSYRNIVKVVSSLFFLDPATSSGRDFSHDLLCFPRVSLFAGVHMDVPVSVSSATASF